MMNSKWQRDSRKFLAEKSRTQKYWKEIAGVD
jgi:hypothetical protein